MRHRISKFMPKIAYNTIKDKLKSMLIDFDTV